MPVLAGIDFDEGGEGPPVIAMHGIGGGPAAWMASSSGGT